MRYWVHPGYKLSVVLFWVFAFVVSIFVTFQLDKTEKGDD